MEEISICSKCGAKLRTTTDACIIFECGSILYADGSCIESAMCARNQRDLLTDKVMEVLPYLMLWLNSEFSKSSSENNIIDFELTADQIRNLYERAKSVEQVIGQIAGLTQDLIH